MIKKEPSLKYKLGAKAGKSSLNDKIYVVKKVVVKKKSVAEKIMGIVKKK